MSDADKRAAGEAASVLIEPGMTLGLGSGSTVMALLEALGVRVRAGLQVSGVPTSEATARRARELGVALVELGEQPLDLAIDGADEVAPDFAMIKGGGGALVREKVVLAAARRRVIIVDGAKVVRRLGRFPLPVEVLPFAGRRVAHLIAEREGVAVELRRAAGAPYCTDNGNHILDCRFGEIADPAALDARLRMPGVVDTGLFIGLCDLLIIGRDGRVEQRRAG